MNKNLKTWPVFLAFLCMGFGDVVGPMVSLAKESFELSNFVASLLPTFGFIMFGILSIPMGVYQDRVGKKSVLVTGLFIALIGISLPIFTGLYGAPVELGASQMSKFYIILIAILLLGAGATILQVSGNPIMRDVSLPGRYSSNLSMGQGIKAIGSSMGFLLPPLAMAAFGWDWTILFPIYAIIILVTVLWVRMTSVKEKRDETASAATFPSCIKLFTGNRYVLFMVLSIFLYVGAEVSMSAQVPILMSESFGFELDKLGLILSWSVFFLPILVGRFTGAAVLRKIAPNRFLILTVALSLVGIAMLLTGNMVIAFAGIILVGLGFANIFPLIFSITIDKLPERANELSGLMVFAIVGGAAIPPLTGFVADQFSLMAGFLVPLACLLFIGSVALTNK